MENCLVSPITNLAFPDNENIPTKNFKIFNIPSISLLVFPKLLHPPVSASFGDVAKLAAFMIMKKTPVHKYDNLILWENNIWSSREVFSVQTISETARKKKSPDGDLNFGVSTPDSGHHFAAGLLINNIRHYQNSGF